MKYLIKFEGVESVETVSAEQAIAAVHEKLIVGGFGDVTVSEVDEEASNKVVIEVTGGVAEVKEAPEGIEVEIIDND